MKTVIVNYNTVLTFQYFSFDFSVVAHAIMCKTAKPLMGSVLHKNYCTQHNVHGSF